MATAEKTWRGGELSVVKSELPEKRDVDRLLELAEKTREKCEGLQERIRRLGHGEILLSFLALMFIPPLLYLLANDSSTFTRLMFSIIVFCCLAVIVFCCFTIFIYEKEKQRHKKNLNIEKLVLEETVNLIREVEPLVSQKEGWSLLERAEFRIRLSRFGIGAQTLP